MQNGGQINPNNAAYAAVAAVLFAFKGAQRPTGWTAKTYVFPEISECVGALAGTWGVVADSRETVQTAAILKALRRACMRLGVDAAGGYAEYMAEELPVAGREGWPRGQGWLSPDWVVGGGTFSAARLSMGL